MGSPPPSHLLTFTEEVQSLRLWSFKLEVNSLEVRLLVDSDLIHQHSIKSSQLCSTPTVKPYCWCRSVLQGLNTPNAPERRKRLCAVCPPGGSVLRVSRQRVLRLRGVLLCSRRC